ncbi:MAG: cation:dicarboxylate symporter family transporter, partial [Gemmatimonadales bacterium]
MHPTARVLAALVAGLALGAAAAALAGPEVALPVTSSLSVVGTLWINAIRMTVIPLVVALVITGVAATADP